MSFLSILLFASAFYFAHGRPQWSSAWDMADTPSDIAAMLAPPSIPIVESSAYQEQLGGFMVKMSDIVDEYLTPLTSQLDLSKQDRLKSMGIDGFASYINYMLLLMQEQEYETYRHDDEDFRVSTPRDVEES